MAQRFFCGLGKKQVKPDCNIMLDFQIVLIYLRFLMEHSSSGFVETKLSVI